MAGPIDKTMQVLASTANPHAMEVLIAALDVHRLGIQQAAVDTLIKRNSSRGQLEVVRHLPRLGDEARASLESQVGRIAGTLKQALLHGDAELRLHGLELVRATESFDQIPTLLEVLKDNRAQITEPAAETMRDLIDRLYEHGQSGRGSRQPGRYLRNATQIKHNVLTGFDRALSNLLELNHQQDVLEAVLIIGDADNFAVKKALAQSGAECRQLAGTVLRTSRHPGVMQLIVDYMSKNYPPPKVLEAVSNRSDPEFIGHLLRCWPKRLTPQQSKNFRQIESVAWIVPGGLTLEFVPEALQPALVEFVAASGLPAEVKLAVHEWIVRHGTPAGRLAAADVLGSMDVSTAQSIVAGGLESEDEEIQAWATHQLRSQGVPEALSLLVKRLDSPLPAVRDAARDELKGFGIATLLDMFEELDPAVCLRAGELIRKIDPDCFDKLRQELECPVPRRRIRAARGTLVLGMHHDVASSLLLLLKDKDPLVRRNGISALAAVRTPETARAMIELLDDPSPRVREEAARVLADLEAVL